MTRVTSISFLITSALLAVRVGAAPIGLVARQGANFQELAYADFQISDGVAGNAEAEANAVFVDPFNGVDLSTVSADVLDAVKNMREAAEDAETEEFNPAIDAATGAEADALQVGKIKNKVLKLTGFVQALNIEIAQKQAAGEDTADREAKLAEEQGKLTKNIATDVASAGDASQGVTGGSGQANAGNASNAAGAANANAAAGGDSTNAGDASAADEDVAASDATSTDTEDSATGASAGSANTGAVAQSAVDFVELDYANFQISDGVAGNAEAEANAVFVDPFAGVDLATVSADVLDAVKNMREAAEDAETELFNPAIDAATGAEADALQVGKIKNKVLKLTGFVQALNIQIAQKQAAGEDTAADEAKLTEEQGKLTKNIATDVASSGDASQSVA